MAYGETYSMFVEKFKPKKTTDDCYTPPAVYEAVAGWVVERYGVDPATFVRPFYPGGDYKAEDYTGKVVVDNPPFSIISQICNFYNDRGIPFFLFAPTLTIISIVKEMGTAVIEGAEVIYENGAKVNTSFVTNLSPELAVETSPELYRRIIAAQVKPDKKTLPVYKYPAECISAASLRPLARNGREIAILRKEVSFTRKLDNQAKRGKAIFGGGFLVSRAAAERAADREKAERAADREKVEWSLSPREQVIIDHLNGKERKNDGYETKSEE